MVKTTERELDGHFSEECSRLKIKTTKAVKKVLERDLEKFFTKECKRIGVQSLKLAIRFRSGWPDRLVASNGLHLAELKTETGQLSELQVHTFSLLEKAGVKVVVLRTKSEITEWLTKIKTSKNLS